MAKMEVNFYDYEKNGSKYVRARAKVTLLDGSTKIVEGYGKNRSEARKAFENNIIKKNELIQYGMKQDNGDISLEEAVKNLIEERRQEYDRERGREARRDTSIRRDVDVLKSLLKPYPISRKKVKEIYADLHKRYPNAQLIAASFNEIAQELLDMKASLPVVTSEIGDTWIYGYGSAPIRMAKFRALSSLYSKWLREKKLDRGSDESLNFAVELGLIAEHTQGMDIKTHLRNWDKYDMDLFLAARSTEAFRKVEKSWKEIDWYIYEAINCLPGALQEEALARMKEIDSPVLPAFSKKKVDVQPEPWKLSLLKDDQLKVEGLFYQMYDSRDYDCYLDNYLRARYGWALDDLGKTGLERSKAVSVSLPVQVVKREVQKEKKGTRTLCELSFPRQEGVDVRVYPEKMIVNCLDYKDRKRAEIELTVFNKPAVRLPEAYWLSFNADDIVSLVAEKTGATVDLLDVVEKGNRQQHGIDRYVDLITSGGTIRIWSEAAFLVNVGEARGLNYSTRYPDKRGGVHFNLSNNLWGTNFSMWNEGSLTYRFTVEML